MKKSVSIIMLLFLCSFNGVQAQISESGYWYNGRITYSAKSMPGGRVVMYAMDEGEEHEFVLVPVAGKKDCYTVANASNGYVNEYKGIAIVRHHKKEGWNVLCFYNKKNLLKAVMSHESEWDSGKISVAKFKNQLIGEYYQVNSSGDGLKLDISWNQINVNLKLVSYDVVTFNGIVLGYITIPFVKGNANRLAGTWEVVYTLDGFILYRLYFDKEFNCWVRERKGTKLEFRKSDSKMRRFGFASGTLLNDRMLAKMDKSVLRIMRNEILASHGYRFKSKDLQEYFGRQAWYKPAASNDDIKLSFIEQLNVELIMAEETDNNRNSHR